MKGEQELMDKDQFSGLVYKSLNIYSSPRTFEQKINKKKIPLVKYNQVIRPNNLIRVYDRRIPQSALLEQFNPSDGMIFDMANIDKSTRNTVHLKHVKVLICVCMYNESKHAINLTLNGIYDNLENLEEMGFSCGDIAVVLIQDGILKLVDNRVKRTYGKGENSMVYFYKKMDESEGKPKCDLEDRIHVILDELDNHERKGMGDLAAKNRDFPISIERNVSLLYQNMWHPNKTFFKEEKDRPNRRRYRLRVLSCFKHLNGTKLSSHLWFFEGFCRYLDPEFCVLLDVGTKPEPKGLANLIKGFYSGSNIGGLTGLMSVDSNFESEEAGGDAEEDKPNCFQDAFFSIEKAQEYEYIISHFLDKNAESALNFLHVLPGAWSAYRYHALIKSQKWEPNLLEKSYFKMILNPNLDMRDYKEANMYLAEDRILSLGIYCQMDESYILKYVPDAVAKTDPMKTHEDLMKQRRRWINSSLFAFLYVLRNYSFNVQESSHNCCRKHVTLPFSMLLALLSFFNSYITPSLYFFIIYTSILQLDITSELVSFIARVVALIYCLVFLTAVGGALTGAAWAKNASIISYILSFFTFALWGLVVYNVLVIYLNIGSGQLNTDSFQGLSVLIISAINIGSFIILLLIHIPSHCEFVCRLLIDQTSYMAYQGAYSQTMVVHAFCNVDDVSWGTKGSGASEKNQYGIRKVFFVSAWLFYNSVLAFIFIYVDLILPQRQNTQGGRVMIGVGIYATVVILFKSLLAFYYHLKWLFCERCCIEVKLQPQNRKRLVDEYWEQTARNYLKNNYQRMSQIM